MFSGKSLIYKRNIAGLRTVPWGTSDDTYLSELTPSTRKVLSSICKKALYPRDKGSRKTTMMKLSLLVIVDETLCQKPC